MSWTGAELRCRLYFLGLTPQTFAVRTGRDLRHVERAVRGISANVSPQMIQQVDDLEELAKEGLRRWDGATQAGQAIVIPILKTPQQAGGLPPQWYEALAGRHIAQWGDNARIEWAA